jgi:hypothetical protein
MKRRRGRYRVIREDVSTAAPPATPKHGQDLLGAICDLLDQAGDPSPDAYSPKYLQAVQKIRDICDNFGKVFGRPAPAINIDGATAAERW